MWMPFHSRRHVVPFLLTMSVMHGFCHIFQFLEQSHVWDLVQGLEEVQIGTVQAVSVIDDLHQDLKNLK